jgi:hypothetical protein
LEVGESKRRTIAGKHTRGATCATTPWALNANMSCRCDARVADIAERVENQALTFVVAQRRDVQFAPPLRPAHGTAKLTGGLTA